MENTTIKLTPKNDIVFKKIFGSKGKKSYVDVRAMLSDGTEVI